MQACDIAIGAQLGAGLLRGSGCSPRSRRSAAAHPHVWITVETTVLYDKGAFTGLQHKWTFDEFYTAMAIEGLDKNKDGIYDREELSELAKVNIDGLKEFAYFTYPVLDGQDVKVGEVQGLLGRAQGRSPVAALHRAVRAADPGEGQGLRLRRAGPGLLHRLPARQDRSREARRGRAEIVQGAHRQSQETGSDDAERLAKAFAQLATPVSATKAVSIDCTAPAP